MKIHLAAALIAAALPAIAHAQAAPAPAPKAEMPCCCEKMERKMECCERHRKGKAPQPDQGSDAHKGHQGAH